MLTCAVSEFESALCYIVIGEESDKSRASVDYDGVASIKRIAVGSYQAISPHHRPVVDRHVIVTDLENVQHNLKVERWVEKIGQQTIDIAENPAFFTEYI